MSDLETLEGVARWVVESTGLDEPDVDPRCVAALHGLRLCHVRGRKLIATDCETIWYDPSEPEERQRGDVAHELGHYALFACDEPNTEQNARFLAGAILCPRRAYDRDLRATEWNLALLQPRYRCSWEVLARRLVELRDAVISIWDNGRLTARVASPWRPYRYKRKPLDIEAAAARLAHESGHHVRVDSVSAYSVPNLFWKREIVVVPMS